MRKDRRDSQLFSPPRSEEVCQGRAEAQARTRSGGGALQKGAAGQESKEGERQEQGRKRRRQKRQRAAQAEAQRVGERVGERPPPFAPPDHGRLRPQLKLAGLSPLAAPAVSAAGGLAQRED